MLDGESGTKYVNQRYIRCSKFNSFYNRNIMKEEVVGCSWITVAREFISLPRKLIFNKVSRRASWMAAETESNVDPKRKINAA